MQALNGRLQVILQDPVELEGLPRREPQRLPAMGAGELVELQPLRGRADAAGQPDANHELIGRLELLAASLVADVAVILR